MTKVAFTVFYNGLMGEVTDVRFTKAFRKDTHVQFRESVEQTLRELIPAFIKRVEKDQRKSLKERR